jgi:hypothetical protein
LLLERALRNIRSGDILVAHLGIWSRQDPWAPAVLEPLITGLKKKGFCFATMDTHPAYREKIQVRQSVISAPDGAVVQPARESRPAAIDVLAPERQAMPPSRDIKRNESK